MVVGVAAADGSRDSSGRGQVNADKSRLGKARHSTFGCRETCRCREREGEVDGSGRQVDG
jgi:hypothetical protein